jgi:hypothetical protein
VTQYCASSDLTDWIDFTTDATVDSDILDAIITRASAIIDSFCNRDFATAAASDLTSDSTTMTIRYFDPTRDATTLTLFLDRDISYISEVINDGTVVTTDQYVTEPRNDTPYYAIKLLASANTQWTFSTDPENAVSVFGWWHYGTSVPSVIVHACMRLSQWIYKQRSTDSVSDQPLVLASGMTIMPPKLPADVISMLEPFRRIRIGAA